jgi:hypothetical protein
LINEFEVLTDWGMWKVDVRLLENVDCTPEGFYMDAFEETDEFFGSDLDEELFNL